jgi:hypothetical protein
MLIKPGVNALLAARFAREPDTDEADVSNFQAAKASE